MPIARKQVANHVPTEEYREKIGRPFLGNGPVKTLGIVERRCFPWGPPRGLYKVEFQVSSVS
jgi:hypothetical protein